MVIGSEIYKAYYCRTLTEETPKDIEQAASQKSDQKGHFEVGNGQFNLVDKGEVVTNYSFDEQDAHKVMFAGLEINEAYGVKVVSYNNTIAFVSLKAPEEHGKDYFNSFVKELGRSDSMHIESIAVATVNDRMKSTLREAFPGILKAYKGDIPDILVYPQPNKLPSATVICRRPELQAV